MKIERMAVVAGALLFAAGCASTDTSRNTATADRVLEARLQSDLHRHVDLAEPGVQCNANNGVVTLTGTVGTEQDRQMIDSLVRNTSGVVAVDDRLQVANPPTVIREPPVTSVPPPPPIPAPVVVVPPPPPEITPPTTPPPAPGVALPGVNPPPPNVTPAPVVKVQQYPKVRAATIADEPIAQFVREHLQREAVPPEWLQNVTITVSDGNAHVQGLVDSQEQHLVIIGATQRAPGIGTVYDELRSRSGPSGNSKS